MRPALLVLLCFALAANAYFSDNPNYVVKRVIDAQAALGLGFNSDGDLFAYDFDGSGSGGRGAGSGGCLYKYKNAADTPFNTKIAFSYTGSCVHNTTNGGGKVGAGFAALAVSKTGRVYLSTGQEIDPNTGAILRQAFNSCGAQHGIAFDPRPGGGLFWAHFTNRKIYRVEDPDTLPFSTTQNTCGNYFFDTHSMRLPDGTSVPGTGIDGITVGPDGLVYLAGYETGTFLVASAFVDTATKGHLVGARSTGTSSGYGPDGISICFGNGVSFAITANAGSSIITRFNLTGPGGAPSYAYSTMISQMGGYVDWTAVDPKGCIWGSTVGGGVYRLSNADGSCPNCASVAAAGGCPNCAASFPQAYAGSVAQNFHAEDEHSKCITMSF